MICNSKKIITFAKNIHMTNHKLTNKDISEQYRDIKLLLMLSDFTSAFAYWVVYQNENSDAYAVDKALKAYTDYLYKNMFDDIDTVKEFTYTELNMFISSGIFENIDEIRAMNETEPNFISLGALSRNMFYMILRLSITQPL
jgi:hypothetical protein